MKKFFTSLIVLVCILTSFSIPLKTSYAYNTYGHKLVNGVGHYGQKVLNKKETTKLIFVVSIFTIF
ncbi:hypothetical protein ACFVR2_01465 [Gottfriedia sp. NPDC057991]|uniref:hypothetical protein n=1 Tax=Gottfriedia sp. NPDC057991 TaxID=3346298 RepID=UPI0036D8DFF9